MEPVNEPSSLKMVVQKHGVHGVPYYLAEVCGRFIAELQLCDVLTREQTMRSFVTSKDFYSAEVFPMHRHISYQGPGSLLSHFMTFQFSTSFSGMPVPISVLERSSHENMIYVAVGWR